MFQYFIIEALTNSCGHFRTMPLRIRRLIGFMHGILHTRCFLFYALLSLRHHVIHFIVYESLNKMNKISNEMICWWMEKIVIDFTFWWKMFEREQQRQTRRIRVIRLHDIYLDSENEILIILSNISEAVDHPDQESSTEFWNLMPRKKVLKLKCYATRARCNFPLIMQLCFLKAMSKQHAKDFKVFHQQFTSVRSL